MNPRTATLFPYTTLVRALVFQLCQAAFAAAVAQGLPLTRVEAGERRFPKGALRCRPRHRYFTHFASSAATLPGAPSSTSVEGSSSGNSASGLPSGSIRKASWLLAISYRSEKRCVGKEGVGTC